MLSERHEAFRYDFSQPLHCQFNIELEGQPDSASNFGDAEILNISPHGLKFKSTLNIPKGWDLIRVNVNFTLMDTEFLVSGHFRWVEFASGSYIYGIHLENENVLQEEIITQLKKFSRKQHNMPI